MPVEASRAGVRKFVTRKYPYLVYYTVDMEAEETAVLTIQHTERRRDSATTRTPSQLRMRLRMIRGANAVADQPAAISEVLSSGIHGRSGEASPISLPWM